MMVLTTVCAHCAQNLWTIVVWECGERPFRTREENKAKEKNTARSHFKSWYKTYFRCRNLPFVLCIHLSLFSHCLGLKKILLCSCLSYIMHACDDIWYISFRQHKKMKKIRKTSLSLFYMQRLSASRGWAWFTNSNLLRSYHCVAAIVSFKLSVVWWSRLYGLQKAVWLVYINI